MKISIIDYGSGNVNSISNMLHHLGIENNMTSDSNTLNQSDKIILPGVGKFDTAIINLKKNQKLFEILNDEVLNNKKPILGICLGMQMLFQKCENNTERGLGWLDGEVCKIPTKNKIKVPHMGWNKVKIKKNSNCLSLNENHRFYFCHSYYCKLFDNDANYNLTSYNGFEFCSVISKKNIFGVQFHPEKSHRYGMQVLKAFIDI